SSWQLMRRDAPSATLVPYTTLFRSDFLVAATAASSFCPGVPSPVAAFTAFVAVFHSALGTASAVDFANPFTCSTRSCTGSSSQRSEEHTSELQSRENLVGRLLLEKK